MECCGINGPEDWKPVMHSDILPKACCRAIPVNGSCTEVDSYKDGCYSKLETSVQENSQLIVWTAVGFALVQVCKILCYNFNIPVAIEKNIIFFIERLEYL